MFSLSQSQKTQTREFFRKIYDMSLKGGGAVLYDANFKGAALARSVKGMTARAIRNIEKTGAAYVSANIFKAYPSGYFRRTDNFLWRFNHIAIDIDFQGDFVHDYQALEDELEWNIRWYSQSYGIPMPNFIVFTGSGGAHLYYTFESLPNGAEKRMVKGIQATKMLLLAKWTETEKGLSQYGSFKVDTCAADASRIFRVPGSIHEDTGRICRMKSTGTPRYTYKNLCAMLSDKPWKLPGSSKPTTAPPFFTKPPVLQNGPLLREGVKESPQNGHFWLKNGHNRVKNGYETRFPSLIAGFCSI